MYAAAAVLFAGACLQGLSGFGYSLFSLRLLVLLMPAAHAVSVLSLTSIFLNLLVFLGTRRHVDLRWMAPPAFGAGGLLTSGVALDALRVFPAAAAGAMLGIMSIASAL